jgi:hypothetical protein
VRKQRTIYVKRDGALKRTRVCNNCAGDAVLVHVGGAPARCSCGALALRCNICAVKDANKDRNAILKAAAKKLRLTAQAYEQNMGGDDDIDRAVTLGRVEGLEQAASVIEAGKF